MEIILPHPLPQMGETYSFRAVCLSVCLFVRPSICPSSCLSICHEYCVLNWAKTTGPILMKREDTCWTFLRVCLDFEKCDLIHRVTRGQKVTNQNHSCLHDTAQTSFPDFDETSGDYAWLVSDELIRFWGMWPNIQGHQDYQIALSGSEAIFVMNEDSNFKFGMATLLVKLSGTFEFEAAKYTLDI